MTSEQAVNQMFRKSIKSTMKPECFNVQTCHDRGPSVFPLLHWEASGEVHSGV